MGLLRVHPATMRTAAVAAVLLLGAAAIPARLAAAEVTRDRDERFLDGLDRRGLDRLAAIYCRDLLAQPGVTPAKQAMLNARWARALAQQAVAAPPGQGEALWREAHEVAQRFLRTSPDNPRRVLVQFQDALIHLARGELARQQADVVLDGRALLEEAAVELREAVARLEPLAGTVETAQRAGQDDDRRADRMSAEELASLGQRARYELARARRNQALCFAADSPDRAHALNRAVELLEPLASLDADHPLVWQSRLQLAACWRLLGDHAAAARQLDALAARQPPAEIRLEAQAEQIQLALDAERLDEAVALLALPPRIDGVASAALAYVRIETCLRAWRAAVDSGDAAAVQRWRAEALEAAGRMELDHGPYWSRRADTLLARHFRTPGGADDLETLLDAAQRSYLGGQFDDALATYDRAAELAVQRGLPDRAVEWGYVAAMIEQRRGRHQAALDRCRRLALALPQQARSPEVHLQAIRNAAEIAKDDSDASWEQYRALVEEHVGTWPAAPTMGQALWWLGRLDEHAGDWPGAIAAYTRLTPDDPNHPAAVAAVGACYDAWIQSQRDAGEPTAELAARAAAWFESVAAPGGQMPLRWDAATRGAALRAARFWLDGPPSGPARAQQILAAALTAAADAPPEWIAAAAALRAWALAADGRLDEARRQLPAVADHPAAMFEFLRGLQRTSTVADARRAEFAAVQLDAIEMLRPHEAELSASDRQTLARLHARALADSGRTGDALAACAALAQAYPRDAEIQQAHAQLLATQEDSPSLELALRQWRGVESKSKPGSALWFRAKYAVAELHERLGRPDQAAEIIDLLELLHPDLGGPAMKARFVELRQRCKKR